MGRLIDLTGIKFGRLTVIERAGTGKRGKRLWRCVCSCENMTEVVIPTEVLMRKNGTKSCGCLVRENYVKRFTKNNRYDLSGDFGIGYTVKGEPFYFDLEDYEKIKDFCWRLDNNGYVVAGIRKSNPKTITMHRLIFLDQLNQDQSNNRIEIDHIYHINHDNRKSQLRFSTHSQNNMNKGEQSNNTSGKAGVSYSKADKIWYSFIWVDNKYHYLGRYKDKQDAIKARIEAEKKYFGNFAYKGE